MHRVRNSTLAVFILTLTVMVVISAHAAQRRASKTLRQKPACVADDTRQPECENIAR